MAKLLPFTTPEGFTADMAYWRPVQCNLSIADKSANVVFYGYKDVQARKDGKQPLAGAVKQYSVSSDQFDKYFAPAAVKGTDHVAQCYKLADDTPDTDSGTKDADGKPVLIPFFQSAQDV